MKELVIGDSKTGICGMIDQIFFNYKADELQIWDWKTNKQMRTSNPYGKKLKGVLAHLDECELVIYSLQLCMYRKILHDRTGLDIGQCYIVWFFEGNEKYKIIECLDLSLEVELIFNDIVNW